MRGRRAALVTTLRARYADAWTNDGRLTLANVRAAADRGTRAAYAPGHEWAVSEEDVLRRRTTAWLAASAPVRV